jgi:hypothetical protein
VDCLATTYSNTHPWQHDAECVLLSVSWYAALCVAVMVVQTGPSSCLSMRRPVLFTAAARTAAGLVSCCSGACGSEWP